MKVHAAGDVIAGRFKVVEVLAHSDGTYRLRCDADGSRFFLRQASGAGLEAGDLRALAAAWRALDVAGVARVEDVFREDDDVFVVTREVAGPTLAEEIALTARPLAEELVVERARTLCDTLDELHRAGVACGVVGPDSVVWDGQRLVVIELDAERALRAQARGRAVDIRVDIYGLGTVLYFAGTAVRAADARARVFQDARSLEAMHVCNDSISLRTEMAVERMLEVEPSRRPADMAEVRRLLGLAPRAAASKAAGDTPARPDAPKISGDAAGVAEAPKNAGDVQPAAAVDESGGAQAAAAADGSGGALAAAAVDRSGGAQAGAVVNDSGRVQAAAGADDSGGAQAGAAADDSGGAPSGTAPNDSGDAQAVAAANESGGAPSAGAPDAAVPKDAVPLPIPHPPLPPPVAAPAVSSTPASPSEVSPALASGPAPTPARSAFALRPISYGRATVMLFTFLFVASAWVARLLYVVNDQVRVKVDPSGKPTAPHAMVRLPVPRGSPLPPTLTGPDGTVMLLVPEGEFALGVPDPDQLDGPQVTNTIDGFYIDRTEVTAGQFARFVKVSGYVAQGPWRRYVNPQMMDAPVSGVTAEDAQEYAKWAGKRLPSEVEWEKAAHGPWPRLWPWGDAMPDRKSAPLYAVTADTASGPQPVASCPQGASPYGALDMAGNVWEWTTSEWHPYSGSRAHSQLFDTGMRVIRGGSWNFPLAAATTTSRMPMAPRLWSPDVGFRCVISVSR